MRRRLIDDLFSLGRSRDSESYCGNSTRRCMTTAQLIVRGILRSPHVWQQQRTQIIGPLFLALAAVIAVGVPSAGQAPLTARPLTLRQVFDSVASHHPLVQAAQARVRAARASSVTAGLLGNPVFTYQVDNAQLPGGPPPDMEREVMITGTLPLEALYQRAPRKRRANSELRAAENEVVVTRQRVALDAARAFHQAAIAQVGVDAAH